MYLRNLPNVNLLTALCRTVDVFAERIGLG
jgi:hypothetical protein